MKHTPLHAAHVALNAKMGEFAGYDMPLYYADGVLKEHEWTRAHAGIFDVSHMGQITLSGKGAAQFLEDLTPSAFKNSKQFVAKYTVLLNPQGGIIDDLIVTRLNDDTFFIVINAGCKEKDIAWIASRLPDDVNLSILSDRALVAVQGPEAERVMREALAMDVTGLGYMRLMEYGRCTVSRLGYTGEDGFELSVPQEDADTLWNRLLAHAEVKPIGLAARDSLRLEMGYCLYGHDIDDTTTPLEADLAWVMRKENPPSFPAPQRKRVGVKLTGKGIAREGVEIFDRAGQKKIGTLTSGTFSPTLKQAVGQGYVETAFADVGTEVAVNVRGNMIEAVIEKMPFVAAKTKK